MLEIKDLKVSYGQRKVLESVSLQVQPGQVVAVVGHNGAGKTTLCKAVMGLVGAESGSITMDGQELANTSPAVTTAAGNLSGGQQQMVAMSIALMADPKLLLLDEPSIGLSPNLVQSILQTVRKLADERGLAAVIVEQNVKVALDAADYVLALRGGRVIFEGPASEVSVDKLWDLF